MSEFPFPRRAARWCGAALLCPAALFAAAAEGPQYRQSSAEFSAGGRGQSARYQHDGALVGAGAPALGNSGQTVLRPGLIGQLTEALALEVQAVPDALDEGAAGRFEGLARLSDGTRTTLAGPLTTWLTPGAGALRIGPDGRFTAPPVYQDTAASVLVRHGGTAALAAVTIRNIQDDDFELYAGDAVPDLWQVQEFGERDPSGRGDADPDADGQVNRAEYWAGTSPTHSASQFRLQVWLDPALPDSTMLAFRPRLDDRTYVWECSTDLGRAWQPLTPRWELDFEDTRFAGDDAVPGALKFYRVRITRH